MGFAQRTGNRCSQALPDQGQAGADETIKKNQDMLDSVKETVFASTR
jgi:hypothetical protein